MRFAFSTTIVLLASACFAESTAPAVDASPPASDFASEVVSFTPGPCAGFGADVMPSPVLGPPRGGGARSGSLDVLSLGKGGTIVLGFGDNAIVDLPGPDFTVFENPFFIGGDESAPTAEIGEVSVSEDGTTWTTFSCTAVAPPYGACAGWHPVFASAENLISPRDPAVSGGDAFDLATLGVSRARFVRIVDKSIESCAGGRGAPTSFGFDLDAIAIVHGER